MRKILTIIFACVAAGCFVQGCNSTGCTDNQNSLPLAGFYSYETRSAITLNDIAVGGVGAVNDSLLYVAGTPLTNVYLPFRAEFSQTAFYFHYTQDGIDSPEYNDTIGFTYSSYPYFASEECGAMLRYQIKTMRYTRHLIDSVAITDSLITNADIERIKIFFRTSS